MNQESWAYNESGQPEKLHPEVAECGVKILQRDLALIKKTGIKCFKRKPYADLAEADLLLERAESRGKPIRSRIFGIAVVNFGHETCARIPLSLEQWKKEHDMPELTLPFNKGFKS
tara:strand:- start:1797 stop:2144 length:348 start_codon:yes stop_codon:yes gene_type:complete